MGLRKAWNINLKVSMKRYYIILFIAICLALSACVQSGGITDNVEVTIGTSNRFSNAEIESAVNTVIRKFAADFKGCELLQLWYDEGHSDIFIASYMNYGRGSINGVESKNVIVLLSNFSVDASGGDGSLNPNDMYLNWNWILIRDRPNSNWRIDDWGY